MEPLSTLLRDMSVPAQATTDMLPDDAARICPICQGMGYQRYDVAYGDPNFGKIVKCACRQKEEIAERAQQLREAARMGPMARKRFERFNIERGSSAFTRDALAVALDAARQYAHAPQGWLVLLGPSGTGKSHLAAAIANAVLEREQGVLWIFVPDFLDHLRATFGPHSDITYDQLFNTVRDTPLLILDDLGAQSSNSWAEEKLYQILNYRYERELPTVITTSRLLDTFEGRIRTRLNDGEVSRVVAVAGYTSEIVTQLMSLSYPLIKRMTFAGIDPHPYTSHEARLQRYNLPQVVAMVQRYAENVQQRRWLVLMGTNGCGKTHLAAAIAHDRLGRGLPTLFIVTPDLLDALRASMGGEGDARYNRIFEEVRSSPFLILDDFGTQSSTPWAREKLYQVLNYRYNAQLPTVITTNLTLEQIDAPLQSRMSDQEYCGVLAVLAPDYRRSRGSGASAAPSGGPTG